MLNIIPEHLEIGALDLPQKSGFSVVAPISGDPTFFHKPLKVILLRFAKAMNFINKENWVFWFVNNHTTLLGLFYNFPVTSFTPLTIALKVL